MVHKGELRVQKWIKRCAVDEAQLTQEPSILHHSTTNIFDPTAALINSNWFSNLIHRLSKDQSLVGRKGTKCDTVVKPLRGPPYLSIRFTKYYGLSRDSQFYECKKTLKRLNFIYLLIFCPNKLWILVPFKILQFHLTHWADE